MKGWVGLVPPPLGGERKHAGHFSDRGVSRLRPRRIAPPNTPPPRNDFRRKISRAGGQWVCEAVRGLGKGPVPRAEDGQRTERNGRWPGF